MFNYKWCYSSSLSGLPRWPTYIHTFETLLFIWWGFIFIDINFIILIYLATYINILNPHTYGEIVISLKRCEFEKITKWCLCGCFFFRDDTCQTLCIYANWFGCKVCVRLQPQKKDILYTIYIHTPTAFIPYCVVCCIYMWVCARALL